MATTATATVPRACTDRVRESCSRVVAHAKHVRIDDAAIDAFVGGLGRRLDVLLWDSDDMHFADTSMPEELALYVMAVDAMNFCFWPSTSSLEYEHLARGLKAALLAGKLSATALAAVTSADVTAWLAPHDVPLVEERVVKLQELGRGLVTHFDASAAKLVRSARGSAVRLVETILQYFPGFRDHAVYHGRQVHFYKRAQIAVADVWAAFNRQLLPSPPSASTDAADVPVGAFYDIDQLTMFADYRVPQLLRHVGVLAYADDLASAIDALTPLPPSSEEEVEIRAATVVAVERIRSKLCSDTAPAGGLVGLAIPGRPLSVEIDWLLWQEGERQRLAIAPHHRTLTCFY